MIGSGFTCRIRTARRVRRCFGKITVFSQRTEYFIRAYMMKKHIGAHARPVFFHPMLTRTFKQGKSSFHICADKSVRTCNGTVYMAFGSKMNYRIYIKIAKQFIQQRAIANISFAKHIALFLFRSVYTEAPFYVRKVFEITAVGQIVQIDNGTFKRRFIEHITNKITADKTGSTGNQNIGKCTFHTLQV